MREPDQAAACLPDLQLAGLDGRACAPPNHPMVVGLNVAQVLVIAALSGWALASAYAGDLAELPNDQSGFEARIGTYVRAGGRLADAQRLLEGDRFLCELNMDAKGSYLWCSRSDGSAVSSVQRRYQVVLRINGSTITSVKSTAGLVGP